MPQPSGSANTARHSSPGAAAESPLTVKDSSSEPVQGWRPWGIGGSDIGALLGLSPYRCAVDVWLEKVNTGGGAVPRPALPMRLGNFLEPFVVEEYERLTSNKTRRQVAALHHPEHAELFGHVDRIATSNSTTENNSAQACGQDIVLECKTCSAFRANEWGPAWSDEVPAEYLAQCLWYLGLTGCEEAHLAVLLGNTDFRVYRIRRDRKIEGHMFMIAHRFWVDHVLTRQPPPPKTRAQAQSLFPSPTPDLSRQAPAEALQAIKRIATLEAGIASAQSEIDRLRDSIALSIGPAERLTWQGETVATWRLSRGTSRLDTERLRRERPEIVEGYTVEGTPTRRLHLKTSTLNKLTTKE